MNCKDCEILLAKHASGEITRQEELLLEEHNRSCPACRAEYVSFNRIEAKLKEYPRVMEDREMFAKVLGEIEHRQESRKKVFFLSFALRAGLAAAALVAFVLVSDIVYNSLFLSDYERILFYADSLKVRGEDPAVKAALQQQQAKELSRGSIDYVTVAGIENALYSMKKESEADVTGYLKDIIRRRSERSLGSTVLRTAGSILNGVASADVMTATPSISEEIRSAVECEKTQNYDEAVRIYAGIRDRKGIDHSVSGMAGLMAKNAEGAKRAYEDSFKLTGEKKLRALVRSMDYMSVVEQYKPEGAKDRDTKFLVAVSLSKTGYGLKSALVLSELKNQDNRTDTGFKAAVNMNLGVAAEKSGIRSVAADCFKEVAVSGVTKTVDLSSYDKYVKYLLEPEALPMSIKNAKYQPVRMRGKDMLQVRPTSDSWYIGEAYSSKSIWNGYEAFIFEVYNPGKKDISMSVGIRQQYNGKYGKAYISTMAARPGYSSIEVELTGAYTMDGSPVNWKKPVYEWYIAQHGGSKRPEVFYISGFRVEKEIPVTASAF